MIADKPQIHIPAPHTPTMTDNEAETGSSRRNPRAGSLLSDSVAALLSSSLFTTVFYPLHRVKILLQTQDSNPLITSGQVRPYRVVTAVPRLVREGGIRELWRGNGAYMLRHVPSTTLSFAFKDAILRALPNYGDYGDLGKAALVNLAAGFIGGAAALFLVYPLDFATIRMASELRHSKKGLGVMDTINSTQRSGGLAALYRGFGVSATAIGAYKALYFGLYDTACAAMEQQRAGWAVAAGSAQRSNVSSIAWAAGAGSGSAAPSAATSSSALSSPATAAITAVHQKPHQHRPTVMQRWAAANLVVITASSLTYPLDVVRKRLVADTALGPSRQQYKGFVDCVKKIAIKEGLGGFYRFYGYDMLLRLGGGVLLVLYDEMKRHGPSSVAHQLLSLVTHHDHSLRKQEEEQQQQQEEKQLR